jgi:hypothetical protein
MTTEQNRLSKLAETKMTLSRKYLNLARISNSKPRRIMLLNRAESFRRQAIECTRK